MDIPLWDSPIRIMWDPDGSRLVLVPHGAGMWALPRLDGKQVVQVAGGIRRTGSNQFARQNESHKLDFSIARIKSTCGEAIEAAFFDVISLPRTKKDILLTFLPSGRHIRLKNCVVESWPVEAEPEWDQVGRETVNILCGEMVADDGTYEEGNVWGELPAETLGTEGGEGIITEGGEPLVGEGYEDP